MTQAQVIIDRIRTISGDRLAAQFSDPEIINWINDAQTRLVNRVESPVVNWQVPSVKGQQNYNVDTSTPYDITRFQSVYYGSQLVSPTTYNELKSIYSLSLQQQPYPTGIPCWYWLQNRTLNLFPAPDTSGIIISGQGAWYPKTITVVTDPITVSDEQIDTLVIMCLENAKEWEMDYTGAEYFAKKAEKQIGEDSYNNQVRQMETYPHVRQVDSDIW